MFGNYHLGSTVCVPARNWKQHMTSQKFELVKPMSPRSRMPPITWALHNSMPYPSTETLDLNHSVPQPSSSCFSQFWLMTNGNVVDTVEERRRFNEMRRCQAFRHPILATYNLTYGIQLPCTIFYARACMPGP